MPPQPIPVITLRLSHPQLLDAVLSSDGRPLYSFETSHITTTLLRCIPDTDDIEQVASVQWPEYPIISLAGKKKEKDNGVRVRIDGNNFRPESEFLRTSHGMMHSSRKFNIPGLERSLRWRQVSSQVWECTSPTTSVPVATFEPANLTSPAKIKIYCTDIYPAHKSYGVAKLNGVCTTLMDYVVLTTLLLVTGKDDWRSLSSASASATSIRSSSASTSVGSNSPTSSSPVSPISPITPFSANQSPSMSAYDARSWYGGLSGNGTMISTSSSCYASSSSTMTGGTGTMLSIRSNGSSCSRQLRPRTSPSSSTLSSLANSSASAPIAPSTHTRAVRRAASQYVRPNSQWGNSSTTSRASTLPTTNSTSSFDDEEEYEESPVLDIRPTYNPHRISQSHSRSHSYSQTPTRNHRGDLRVEVPSTPTTTFSSSSSSIAPTSISSAYPHINSRNLPFLKTDPAELPPPPPYEEIDWTVRVKTPRRVRSTVFTQ